MGVEHLECSVEITLALLGNKWKVLILRELFTGTKRFGELSRGVHGISQKMLTQQLRQMEEDNLVKRKVYPEVPPRVEYSLTDIGKSLSPILDAMHKWGSRYKQVNGVKARGKKTVEKSCAVKGSVA
ncbi:MAG: MarR family transcriptional regulator [Nitrospirae bacterium GWC2_57_9]|nr:MAG: MarR family transcriptional regulator [Nitrospirae bacterium GWC2_57_9]